MYRSLALLALPLLVVGCQPARAPATSIDSFRSTYFSQSPAGSSQVAALPQSAPAAENVAPRPHAADPPAAVAEAAPAQIAAAASKPAGPPPYKASVAAYIKRYAVDSNSLKLAKIGTPFPGSVHGQKGSVICVELGGLSSNRTAYLLKDNDVVDSEFGAPACHDKKLQPWDSDNAGA
jgi:hypothetical protein